MAYNPNSSPYTDIFDGKFNSFDATGIVTSGNNALKSNVNDMEMEENSSLALGYDNKAPGFTPNPGKFFED